MRHELPPLGTLLLSLFQTNAVIQSPQRKDSKNPRCVGFWGFQQCSLALFSSVGMLHLQQGDHLGHPHFSVLAHVPSARMPPIQSSVSSCKTTPSRYELWLGPGVQLQGPMRNCPAMYPRGAWVLSWAPASAASAVLPGTINSPMRLFRFYLLRKERRTPANKNIVSIRNYSLEMTGKIQFLQFIRLAGAAVWVVGCFFSVVAAVFSSPFCCFIFIFLLCGSNPVSHGMGTKRNPPFSPGGARGLFPWQSCTVLRAPSTRIVSRWLPSPEQCHPTARNARSS